MNKETVISKYLWEMDHGNPAEYIVKNASKIKNNLGRKLLKEMILNYRVHNPKNKQVLLDKFYDIIYHKQDAHVSDLAIAYNIVTGFGLNDTDTNKIINFMYDRVKTQTPLLASLEKTSNQSIKNNFTLKHVEQVLEERKGYNNVC
jgi:hypothetical protein